MIKLSQMRRSVRIIRLFSYISLCIYFTDDQFAKVHLHFTRQIMLKLKSMSTKQFLFDIIKQESCIYTEYLSKDLHFVISDT